MSKNLERVIQRAISDAAFRRQLQSNPDAALRGFKLTQDEVAALRSGDAGKLTSLGIDQRMSKTFSFGGGDLATRLSTGGDMTSVTSRIDADNTSGDSSFVIPNVSGVASVDDPIAGLNSASVIADPDNPASRSYVGDPIAELNTASVIADPDNPASRLYVGDQATAPSSDDIEDQSHAFAASRSADVSGSSSASVIADPDNPASRSYVGDQATAPSSDAIEDQSHAFAAGRSADISSSGLAAPIEGTPEEFSFRDQGASGSASVIADPDNPASRSYVGDQATAPSSDAIEDQSHAFAAGRSADISSSGLAAPIEGTPEEFSFRDQGASSSASVIADPDNPASRLYAGGQQSDAFLSEGEAGQYSADPNWSSDQAEDTSHAFNPDGSEATVDDVDTSARNGPDVPV